MQQELFSDRIKLNVPDGDIELFPSFIKFPQTSIIGSLLLKEIAWKQDTLKVYGKDIPLPRLTAWYGDKGYSYSGIVEKINAWTPFLVKLKNRIEEATDAKYNGVLLNYYRSGKDSIGWHSDDKRIRNESYYCFFKYWSE